MTRALRGLAALTLIAVAPLAAQQGPVADRMFELGGKPYPENAACRLSGGDFRLTGATTKLSSALENHVPENKRRLLLEGRDLTIQSIQGGQAGSSKAWYYLGRFYLQAGDLAGADSAFTKTVALAPTCQAEVQVYRLRAWSVLMSAAGTHRTASRADSAMYLARQATLIEANRPQSWYTIGAALLEQQQNDSAAYYFLRAVAAPADSSANAVAIRQAAAFQVAVIDYNKRDFTGAVRNFAEAVRLKPEDADAKRNLAAALRQAGMADSAAKVEQSMMSAEAGSEAGLTIEQLSNIGVAQYNQRDFAGAATTFEKILAAEPFNRDALFNLAQSYNGVSNFDKLLEVSLRLRAMDPLSFSALQLVGMAYRGKHDQPKVLETATALGGATVDVQVSGFTPTATGATLTLRAFGRDGRDINDRAIRAVAIPVVIEFLNKDGAVVGTTEAVVPALANNATQEIPVTGTGAGVIAWRYHRK
jgi:tetratricopeptide (TPR) repeat protein